MFNQADRTFARVPRALDSDLSLRVLGRIRDHYVEHGLSQFTIVLHGGEPTLWPDAFLRRFLDAVTKMRDDGINLDVEMQTNGYKLRPSTRAVLRNHGVRIGISLDGPPAVNDLHRVNHAGRGSYERVMSTVKALQEAEDADLIGGFLCVADPDCAPSDFLAWAGSLPVPRLDVLWPIQYSYACPPWPLNGLNKYRESPRYGEWFAELFRLWWKNDDPELHIRLFEQCILWWLGGRRHADMLVNDHVNMFVVNTDGGYEYPDYFRAHTDGGSRTRFNVDNHSITDLAGDGGFRYCLSLIDYVPAECSGCDVLGLCGGGFLPGRMSDEAGLPRQKSVLCYDEYRFFTEVVSILAPYERLKTTPRGTSHDAPSVGGAQASVPV